MNRDLETFYPTTLHYLFAHGGYGLLVNGGRGLYWTTHVTLGAYSTLRRSENPWFKGTDGLGATGLTVGLQAGVGSRF